MIRVLIIDGSSTIKLLLGRELSKCEDLKIVGMADNPYTARDIIIEQKPDIVIMGFKMPIMDGITFLKKLMRYYPLPVIMISAPSLSSALEAKKAGAVDLFYSPQYPQEVKSFARLLASRIKSIISERQKILEQHLKLTEKYVESLVRIFDDEVKSFVMTSAKTPSNKQGAFFTLNTQELNNIQETEENIGLENFEIDYFIKKNKRLFIN